MSTTIWINPGNDEITASHAAIGWKSKTNPSFGADAKAKGDGLLWKVKVPLYLVVILRVKCHMMKPFVGGGKVGENKWQ